MDFPFHLTGMMKRGNSIMRLPPQPEGRGSPFHSLGVIEMDVQFFLHRRTAFIRNFYSVASAPFVEVMRKILAKEDPYVPPYSEDGEPPFLEEWQEAKDSIAVIGQSCVSMLAAALHLYFKAWERELGCPIDSSLQSTFKKQGWLSGYMAHFTQRTGIVFDCPAINFDVLQEVVLARNRAQHPESIFDERTYYTETDLKKLQSPFFIDDRERTLFASEEFDEASWLIPPTVYVTEEKLLSVIHEVERFAEWFESVDVSQQVSQQ